MLSDVDLFQLFTNFFNLLQMPLSVLLFDVIISILLLYVCVLINIIIIYVVAHLREKLSSQVTNLVVTVDGKGSSAAA